MARKQVEVLLSDLSGVQIPEGAGALVTVTYNDGRPTAKLDVTDAEIGAFLSGRGGSGKSSAPATKRRGRTWTPEQKAAQAQLLRDRHAARKAAEAGAAEVTPATPTHDGVRDADPPSPYGP